MRNLQQEMMNQMQIIKMAQMQGLIARANADPRSLTQDELALANQYANMLGSDMSAAKARDVATNAEKWIARIGGGVDALAFGLLPDKWYSSYRTKNEMNQGKMVGNIAGLFVPGIGALKAVKGGASAIKALKAIKATDTTASGLKLAYGVAKQMPKSQLIALANALIARPMGVASSAINTDNIGLGNNPQQSPFQTIMPMDPNGMPPM